MQTHSIHNAPRSVRFSTSRSQPESQETKPQPKETFTSSAQDAPTLREAFDKIHNSGGVAKARLLDDNAESWNARCKVLWSAKDTINT